MSAGSEMGMLARYVVAVQTAFQAEIRFALGQMFHSLLELTNSEPNASVRPRRACNSPWSGHGCREIGDAKETADPLGDLGAQPAPGPV